MKRKRDRIGQEIELWLYKSLAPTKSRDKIKSQILERVQEELDDNRNIGGLDYILSILPLPLRMYLRDCSPLNTLKKVPVLQDMDEEGLKEICGYLKPMKFTNDIIISAGKPLQLMLIIVEGVVHIEKRNYWYSTNSQRGVGELCGGELLCWPALISFPDIPLTTESARALGDVEALALMASDMEIVGIKFATHFQEYGESGRLYVQQNVGPVIFTEKDLKKATNDFHVSRVLGEGRSATVYEGTLPDKLKVAVKKTRRESLPSEYWLLNEMLVLSSVKHNNVVRLIGYCLEKDISMLVLEYMEHGSLYDHIHKRNGKGSPPLPLEVRLKVAAEIARAVAYLHSATPMIIHGDVKSTNILLDENYTAKLIDFEYARLVDEDRDPLYTFVIGTPGYLDPEYLITDILTAKSDVYSFGVVLMELLTSRKPVDEDLFVAFLDHKFDHDVVSDGNLDTAEKMAGIAKRCTRLRREEAFHGRSTHGAEGIDGNPITSKNNVHFA